MEFRMETAVRILGLQCDTTRPTDNALCPMCYETHGKKKLNLNFRKNVFRCAKCGVNGGVVDLVRIFTGKSHDEAVEMIRRELRVLPNEQITYVKKEEVKEAPLADIEVRDKVYKDLMAQLSLSYKHRKALRNRGLSDDMIDRLGYKSAPVYPETLSIPVKIIENGLSIAGVPGFCKTKDGKRWWLVNDKSGILIPVKDLEGRIQGLKIRLDNETDGKFRWISSVGRCEGAGAENWIHISGTVGEEAILTEGPMKGDLASLFSGNCVIAIAGVNSIEKLSEILMKMKSAGTKRVLICFDMDLFHNPHVQEGLKRLCELISRVGMQFKIMMWDSSYKGIDDYLYNCKCNREKRRL